MRRYFFIILILCLCVELGYSQFKLKDIHYDLSNINKEDKNGKQGTWFFYDKLDSTVFAMENFENDSLNGYFERYWKNGKVSEMGFYKNGSLDSIFIAYWENGRKRGQANYIKGSLNGIVETFNSDENLTSRSRYVNGIVDTLFKESFLDSSLVWDSQMQNKIDTVVTAFKSDWNKKYAIYKNDTLRKEISFYKDVIAIENYFEGAILLKRIVYSKIKPYSKEKIFYYQNGVLLKSEFYDKNGNLIKKDNQN